MKNKKNDITGMAQADLDSKIKEEKAALNKMTLNHAISPVEDPSKIRVARRNVARLLTEASKRKTTSNK